MRRAQARAILVQVLERVSLNRRLETPRPRSLCIHSNKVPEGVFVVCSMTPAPSVLNNSEFTTMFNREDIESDDPPFWTIDGGIDDAVLTELVPTIPRQRMNRIPFANFRRLRLRLRPNSREGLLPNPVVSGASHILRILHQHGRISDSSPRDTGSTTATTCDDNCLEDSLSCFDDYDDDASLCPVGSWRTTTSDKVHDDDVESEGKSAEEDLN